MEKVTGGLGALEYAKFRRNRQGEAVIAVVQEDEVKVKTMTITDSGNTAMVPAEADKATRLKGFLLSREGGNAVAISFREDTGGELKYSTYLATDGDYIRVDLSHIWALNTNKPLYVYASGACNVHVTIEYEGPSDSSQEGETLADTQSIAEAIAKDVVKATNDSQTIAEALAKAENKGALADSQTIVDSPIVWTGSVSKGLTDELAIASSLGATRFLSLSDAMSVAASMVYEVIPG